MSNDKKVMPIVNQKGKVVMNARVFRVATGKWENLGVVSSGSVSSRVISKLFGHKQKNAYENKS